MSSTDQPSALARSGQPRARRKQSGAERYVHRQRALRRGRDPAEAPHPLEYDESGFPLAQRNSSFVERVTRLLNPR
jgi:hypothetical protein